LDRRDGWVGPNILTRMDYKRAIRLDQQFPARAKWRSFSSASWSVRKTCLT